MSIGIIVLAHRQPTQVGLLMSALQHPEVDLYLHVDARATIEPFKGALDRRGVERVSLLPRHRTRWGGVEMVDATLAGLTRALRDGHEHVLLISGQDMPVWPVDRIVSFFGENRDRSFISHFPLPDPRWRYDGRARTEFYTYTVLGRRETCIPRGVPVDLSWKGRLLNRLLRLRGVFRPPRAFPAYVRPYGGHQWWNLSRVAAEHVLQFLEEHPGYRVYHEHSLAPDEMFFQSILLGTGFAENHDIVNDALRFMIWPEESSHPLTLTEQHVPVAIDSGMPFARKIDMDEDEGVVRSLGELVPFGFLESESPR